MTLEKIAKTQVATVFKNASLDEAAKLMRDLHVGDLVVVENRDHAKVPIGMLTDRDIVVSTLAVGIDPKEFIVQDIMSSELAVAKLRDGVFHVMNLMKENGYKRIPLVNDRGVLVGIVSSDDLLAWFGTELGALASIVNRQRNVEIKRRRRLA